MPILREHDVAEVFRDPVDERYDFIALRYGKCAAGTEVVLHIDYNEDVAVADRISYGQFCLLVFLPCARWLVSYSLILRSSPTAKINAGATAQGFRHCDPRRAAR